MGNIHDSLAFFKLLTTPLITTYAAVLAIIKRKDFAQYIPTFYESDSNIVSPNKFYLFHHDH